MKIFNIRYSLAMVAIAVSLINAPTTANAATGCVGAACNGKDPQAMGCGADARTIASTSRDGVRVELRYSRKCNARWARTTELAGNVDATPFAQLGSGSVTLRSENARSVYSFMWAGRIRACGGVYAEGPGLFFCTVAR